MHPVPRIFFQKNQKKWIFFKNTTTNHICSKNEFFEQNTTTDWIFLSWKFWDPMLWPIKFFKKSQKWPIFYPFGSGKWIWKKSKIQIQIYNSPHELWKKSRFCQLFSRKNRFFSDFVSFFSFCFEQTMLFRIRQWFHFSDFINFSRQKIKFFFLWGKQKLLFSKKTFYLDLFEAKKKIFISKLNHPPCPAREPNFYVTKILLKFWNFVIVGFPFDADSFK